MTDPLPGGAPTRRRGRPSVAAERRGAILHAYLELMAEAPAVTVPMHEVARRAGVARTAVAHFVGDHDDLQAAAVDELRRRYEGTIHAAAGPEPSADALVDLLFTDDWATGRSSDDLAFDHFVLASMTNPIVAHAVRATYELLTRELAAALARDHPDIHPDEAASTAYSIVCLAEFNTTLQRLGFPPRRSHDAHAIARHLLHRVADGTGSSRSTREDVQRARRASNPQPADP